MTLFYSFSQPYIICRQCPGYRGHSVPTLPGTGQEAEAGGTRALGDAPSTSADFPAGQSPEVFSSARLKDCGSYTQYELSRLTLVVLQEYRRFV